MWHGSARQVARKRGYAQAPSSNFMLRTASFLPTHAAPSGCPCRRLLYSATQGGPPFGSGSRRMAPGAAHQLRTALNTFARISAHSGDDP
jgi:hypothetical protein